MLLDFLTFNIGASRNQRTILIEMYNIVGDDPSTIWMGNVMVCTWNIHPINMIRGKNKRTEIDNTTKREGIRVQGIVENQMEWCNKKTTHSLLTYAV